MLPALYDFSHALFSFRWYSARMKPESKGYFLKEYGSWSVLTVACIVGIGVSR
jgi:hypothetical protein